MATARRPTGAPGLSQTGKFSSRHVCWGRVFGGAVFGALVLRSGPRRPARLGRAHSCPSGREHRGQRALTTSASRPTNHNHQQRRSRAGHHGRTSLIPALGKAEAGGLQRDRDNLGHKMSPGVQIIPFKRRPHGSPQLPGRAAGEKSRKTQPPPPGSSPGSTRARKPAWLPAAPARRERPPPGTPPPVPPSRRRDPRAQLRPPGVPHSPAPPAPQPLLPLPPAPARSRGDDVAAPAQSPVGGAPLMTSRVPPSC